jgi:tetratricopeptide (TPR) repeat protein
MTTREAPGECPSAPLSAALGKIKVDPIGGLSDVEHLLDAYPRDRRLHFLKGSVLAGLERYDEARRSMETATRLAPDYAVARFQLGFLELTSGDAARALSTWGPLHRLPADHPLRLFATGLEHLINDRYAQAIETLEAGIARNAELPPLNADMNLIIAKIRDLSAAAARRQDEPLSAAHLLLQQYKTNSKAH